MTRQSLTLMAALFVLPLGNARGQQKRGQTVDPAPPRGQPTGGATVGPTLAPGDALRINVWRHPELSGEFAVAADSALSDPLYQTVKVAGVPLAVARDRIRSILATYEQDVRLTVEALWSVSVVGEVRTPNLYRLPQGTTVAQAVALAGGPTERGRLDRVLIIRPRGRLVLDLMGDYQRAQTVVVAAGDQVVVDRRSDFSIMHDVLMPLATFTAAIAATYAVFAQ